NSGQRRYFSGAIVRVPSFLLLYLQDVGWLDPKCVHSSVGGQVVVIIRLSPESNPQGTIVGVSK
ncbi:unnamed protein product, partial [Ilex paraguariensis]